MLGAAHSMANPLTAHFDIIHGQAVGVALPAVIRRNSQDAEVAALYRELLSSQPLDAWITTQVANQGLATCLSDLNVSREMLHQLAKEASTQWTAQFNPIGLTADDFEQLYQSCY